MSVLLRLKFRTKTLRLRRDKGNAFIKYHGDCMNCPVVEQGPFGCWLISWNGWQIGWELNRWA